jgi:serine/threonine-protein kinase
VLSIAKQLCRALEVAHEQGVVHGDIKPRNLLVGRDGVLTVTDFGVARLVRRVARPPHGAPPGGAEQAQSEQQQRQVAGRLGGAVVGTPEYMAPDQLLGGEPDVRADVYAAGMVLHECVTGATPFQADTPLAFLARKLDAGGAGTGEQQQPPRAVTPPPALAVTTAAPAPGQPTAALLRDVIARMTARDAESRPTAGEAYETLSR